MVKAVLLALALAWSAPLVAHEAHTAHGDGAGRAASAPRVKAALAIGAAVAPTGELWLVGLDGANRLFVQRSADAGASWRDRRLLDTGDDKIAAEGENRPKIAFGPAGRVVISYTQPLAKPYTGAIRLLRSDDGGASFAAPGTVHRDRQLITHRFESIRFDAAGTLHTVWIDKRDQALALAAGQKYAGAAIYRNESSDGGLSFGPDIKLAEHSCECCRIALAPTPEGRVAALWRHVFVPNIRDHAFAVLGDEARAPVRASFDDWRLDACPHHGPGLTPAARGGYHAVWFGDKQGRAAVRTGRLDAAGAPQGVPRELPDARAEHAAILADGARLAIVWRSYDGSATRLSAWLSDDDGDNFQQRELATSSEPSDHPLLVNLPQGLHAVWRTGDRIHVLPLQP